MAAGQNGACHYSASPLFLVSTHKCRSMLEKGMGSQGKTPHTSSWALCGTALCYRPPLAVFDHDSFFAIMSW